MSTSIWWKVSRASVPERLTIRRRATLVTFNYDPLIECAVATGLLYEWGQYDSVFWTEIRGDVPSWPPGLAYLAADKAHTLRLLKLHGSLNWYWVPRDASGVSIARRDLPAGATDSGVRGAVVLQVPQRDAWCDAARTVVEKWAAERRCDATLIAPRSATRHR